MTQEKKHNTEFLNTSKVQLDMTIGISDITDVVVVRHEEALLMEKDQIDANLKAAKKAYADLNQNLTEMAEELMETVAVTTEAKKLCEHLNKFDGGEYTAVTRHEEVDMEEKKVTVSILVVDAKLYNNAKDRYYRTGVIREKLVTEKFDKEMKKKLKEIEKQADKVNGIQEELVEVRKKLAGLPQMLRKAKAAIVEAQLKGEIDSPEKILTSVLGIEPKALPYNES